MEKTTKMIAAAVVLVLCAVAVIGVGYAYTAQTINSGNNASTEYTVINQDGTGAYQFASGTDTIDWNTKDYRTGESPSYKYQTDFWLEGAVAYSETGTTGTTAKAGIHDDYLLVPVGSEFTLETQPQTGGKAKDYLECVVTGSGFELKAGTVLFLEINNGSGTNTILKWESSTFKSYDNGSWTGDGKFRILKNTADETGTTYKNATVNAFYGYEGDTVPTSTTEGDVITVEHDLGEPPATAKIPSGKPVNDAKLIFTITVA